MDNNEASDLIELALNEAMKSSEDYREGDVIVDWVLVGFTTHPDVEEGYSYPTFYSNGEMPHYRARGLLMTALLNLEKE